MTRVRPIASFLLIAVLVSIVLAYVGAIISWADNNRFPSPFELLLGPLIVAPIYALFLAIGGLVFGLPALLSLRKFGLAHNRTALIASGTGVGTVAASVILLGWLGLVAIPSVVSLGAIGGGLAAALWFELEEKRQAYD